MVHDLVDELAEMLLHDRTSWVVCSRGREGGLVFRFWKGDGSWCPDVGSATTYQLTTAQAIAIELQGRFPRSVVTVMWVRGARASGVRMQRPRREQNTVGVGGGGARPPVPPRL